MVGGVAMLDYNRDGHLDLFFVNGAALADPMAGGSSRTNPIHASGIVSTAITETEALQT